MLQIIDKTTKKVEFEDKENKYTPYGFILQFFEGKDIGCYYWETLSELIQTMTGDAVTPFNTIGELIETIPNIVDCTEETEILCVMGKTLQYYIVRDSLVDREYNIKYWNLVLQHNFSDLELIEK